MPMEIISCRFILSQRKIKQRVMCHHWESEILFYHFNVKTSQNNASGICLYSPHFTSVLANNFLLQEAFTIASGLPIKASFSISLSGSSCFQKTGHLPNH